METSVGQWTRARVLRGAHCPRARAHHSFAMYDMTATKTMTGKLTRFIPGSNHAQLIFEVIGPDGKPVMNEGKPLVWGVETGVGRGHGASGRYGGFLPSGHDSHREPASAQGRSAVWCDRWCPHQLRNHSSGRWLQRENGQEFPGACQLNNSRTRERPTLGQPSVGRFRA